MNYTDRESENNLLDNLTKSGTIKWNDDKQHCGTWSGYDIPNTCLRMFYKSDYTQGELRESWYISTLRFSIVQKTLYSLKDFPSPAELERLHLKGLQDNEPLNFQLGQRSIGQLTEEDTPNNDQELLKQQEKAFIV